MLACAFEGGSKLPHSKVGGSILMKRAALFFLLTCIALSGCSKDPKAQRDKYYVSGQKYLEEKRYEEAAIEFRNALRIDKDHVPTYLGIAKAFQQMSDHQNAIAAYQQVAKLDSNNIEAKLRLGEYLLAASISRPDLFKQAQQMAEEVLKLQPSNVDGMILLGNAYSGQNEIDKSIQHLEKALLLDPGNLKATMNLAAAHFKKNDIDKAEATFREALQKHPKAIEPHLAIAAFYAATRRLQETEIYLKKAFDLAPADPRCISSLVSFYMSANKPSEAEGVFRSAINRNPKEIIPRLGLANFYLKQGLVDKGIESFNETLKVSPGSRDVLLPLAEIYLSRDNLAKAEECVHTVLAANKNDAQAHHLQGMVFRKRNELDKAMQEFDIANKLDASMLPTYMEKANLLLMRGDLDACETTLKAALQVNKSYIPARAAYAKLLAVRQRPQEALQLAQEVLMQAPNTEDAIAAQADALRILRKFDESKRDWLRLIELKPQNALYQYRLGMVEAAQSDTASALIHFRKAAELQPGFVAAIGDIVYLQLQAKQYDAALSELDRLAKSSTPQDEIHRLRGQVYLAKGDMQAAENEFRKTIELNPQNYQTYILLGNLSLKRNNIPQAIKEVDQLIAKNNKLSYAFLLKAYYLQMAKDVPGAISNYRKVLDLDRENPVAANNLAWLLCENSGNLEEALTLAKAARRKAPDDPGIADTLGWIYYKMKNYTLAIDQLSFSINNRKQPSAENYYHMGMALHAKGDLVQAKQALKKALDLSSTFPGADEARKLLKQANG
jgi:tetratricopeptide (TPR) repeat protein